MEVFRFDEEVRIPISEFGSRFRIGPLTGGGANVRVQLIYLPPDGASDGTAQAASQLWREGEEHDASSDDGLTAVCIEGTFDVWAAGVTTDIVVSDYDPSWREWFDIVSGHVWPAVEDVALRIDHVGSTAVPGLAAKPIIDMDIVVASDRDVPGVIDRLAGIGYRWRGDLGVPGRQAVTATSDQGFPVHNLYVVVDDNEAHLDHWLLRDLLRGDPDAREQYAALKKVNARLAAGDLDVYMAAKASLVAQLLTRARAERRLPPVTYWQPDVELP